MSEELQLRGHGGALRLAAVPCDDGRTLLVSTHQGGAVRVWDPWTGEPVAGPVRLSEGEERVNDLAIARLGPDSGRVLVTCDARSVRLWDPATLVEAGALPRRIARQGAWALAVLPATASTPELLVTAGRKGVRVTDPASGRTHFRMAQPPRRHLGGNYCLLTPVRLDGGVPGFAVGRGRWGVEVWAPARRNTWQRRHRWDHLRSPDGGMAFLSSERGEPWLAVAVGREVTVWDLGTGRLKAQGELDTRIMALAAVPLGERTVLAVSGQNRGAGVRLWDPSTGRTLGDLFNGHGPPRTSATVMADALAVIPGPDGTVRVASAANDGVIRVSPPFSGPHDTPPERLPDLGPPEEHEAGSRFALIRERSSGAVQGFWFADPEHAANRNLVDALLHREGLHRLVGTRYRTQPNTVDDRGGAFVLFG